MLRESFKALVELSRPGGKKTEMLLRRRIISMLNAYASRILTCFAAGFGSADIRFSFAHTGLDRPGLREWSRPGGDRKVCLSIARSNPSSDIYALRGWPRRRS